MANGLSGLSGVGDITQGLRDAAGSGAGALGQSLQGGLSGAGNAASGLGSVASGLGNQVTGGGQDLLNWLMSGGAGNAAQGLGQAGQNNMTGSPLDWLYGGGLGRSLTGVAR